MNRVIQIQVNASGNAAASLGSVNTAAQQATRSVNGLQRASSAAIKVGAGLTAGLTAPLALFGKSAFSAASDAQEMKGAFSVVFGEMSADVESWAETTGDALGRSTEEIQRGALAFQELFGKALDPKQAVDMSKQFAVLTQDLASFKNLSNDVAQQKLFSGLTGEAEPLKSIGVFINAAAVDAKALALGLGGVNGALTDQDKIVARAALIQEQLSAAQGDVIRTADSTANQIKASEAAFEELQVQIGSKLLPTLTPFITKLGELFGWFSQLSSPTQSVIIGIAGLAAVAGPVITIFGAIASIGASVGAALGLTGAGAAAAGAGAGTASVGFGALTLAAAPWIALAAGIAAAGYLIYDNWDSITAVFSGVGDALTSAWADISEFFSEIWSVVTSKFQTAFTVLKALVLTFTPIGIIYKHWDSITDYFSGLWDSVKSVFSYFFTSVKDEFLNQPLVQLIYQNWDSITGYFSDLWNSVISGVSSFVDDIKNDLLDFIPTELILKYWDEMPELFSDIWTAVSNVFSDFWGIIESAAEGNFNPINMIYDNWDNIANWFEGLWNNVKNAFVAGWNNITSFASNWSTQMLQFGRDIINGLVNGIRAAPSAIKDALFSVVSSGVNGVKSFLGIRSPSRMFMGIGSNVVEGLAIGIDSKKKVADAAFTKLSKSAAAGAKKLADEAKKKAEQAESRLTKQKEFFESLQKEADVARLNTVQAALFNKEAELRNILNENIKENNVEINEEQRKQIKNGLTLLATNKALNGLDSNILENQNNINELLREKELLQKGGVEGIQDEINIENKLSNMKKKFLEEGVNLNDAAVQASLAQYEATEREVVALQNGNKLLEQRQKLAADLISNTNARNNPLDFARQQRELRDNQIESIKNEVDSEQLNLLFQDSARQYNEDLRDIHRAFRNNMLDAIDNIAAIFGGVFGDGLNAITGIIDGIGQTDAGAGLVSGITGGLDKFFGGEGKFTEALQTAGAGAQVGDQIASLANAVGLGNNFSRTGSKLGGAAGSFLGPLGTIGGSLLGGIVGGLFKSTEQGSSTIGLNSSGSLEISSFQGNSFEAETNSAANAVISGLNDIAESLGASIGSAPSVSIGIRNDEFRVDTTGSGRTRGQTNNEATNESLGLFNFRDDVEGAIAFAIQDAIRDGVLVGLSSFSDRLLRNADNLDSAIALAQSYENILDELAAYDDPLGASFNAVTEGLDRMLDQMRQAGATADELANVERFRAIKLEEVLEDQLSSLTDFQRQLNGDAGGVSSFNQLQDRLSELDVFRDLISSGSAIDQNDFTSLGSEITNLASEIFGTSTSQFQDIRADLLGLTADAIGNVETAAGDATITAIEAQTAQQSADQQIANDYLRQIAAAVSGGGSSSGNGARGGARNGVISDNVRLL